MNEFIGSNINERKKEKGMTSQGDPNYKTKKKRGYGKIDKYCGLNWIEPWY